MPSFVEVDAPTDEELPDLLQTLITRLMKLLTRRGVLVEEMGQTYLAEPDADADEARTLRPLQAAGITYRIAFGPRAGHKVLTLRGAQPRESPPRQSLCADIDGFSLHPAVSCEAHDRKRLEQLCAPSPARRRRTNGCSAMPPGRWSSSSRRPGATAPRTRGCRRWSSCSGWPL